MNKLEELIKKNFPNKEIIKLEDITTKISIIPKVRYGKNRTFTDYDEISLQNIDSFGVIYVPENKSESEPANRTAVINQSLVSGDLIILHRGKIGKMGIIGDEYKRRIVGNNSMMRVQFEYDKRVDTPWLVMQFLQLDYVREYIDTFIPSSGAVNRKILNSEVMKNLPIPKFEESNGLYKDFLFQKKHSQLEVQLLIQKLQTLEAEYKQLSDESIHLFMNKPKNVIPTAQKDMQKLEQFMLLSHEFEKFIDKE